MKNSIVKIAFFQAAGIVAYVIVFASIVNSLQTLFPDDNKLSPFIGISIFLLAFIISVTVCGSLMFGYPIFLFSKGKKAEAFKLFLWSLGWLVFLFLCIGSLVFFFFR